MHFNPFWGNSAYWKAPWKKQDMLQITMGRVLKSRLKSGSKICSARIKYASRFPQKLSKQKLNLEFGQTKRLLAKFLHQ